MRILSIFALLLLWSSSSFAQGRPHHPHLEKIAEELQLSTEQKKQWKTLHQKMREEHRAHRASGQRPSPEQRQAKRAAHEEALQNILTEEQWEKFQEMRPAHHQAGHAEKMAKELNLSPEQQSQLQELHKAHRKERQAERERLQNGGFPDLVRYYEQRQAHQSAMQEVLSEEQWEQLQAKKAERRAQQQQRRAEGAEQRQARRAYRQTEIRPKVQELRQELESQINTADKERLTELRQSYRTMRKALRSLRQTEVDEGPSREKAEAAQAILDKHRSDIEEMRVLLEKYRSHIQTLLSSISEEEHQAWKNNMRPEGPARKGGRHAHKHRPSIEGMLWGGHKNRKALRFLLMQPKADVAQEVQRAIKAYPSPAANNQSLSFQVLSEGAVRVELIRQSGKLVRVLLDQQLKEGMHQLEVDLSMLPTGSYFYRISDAKGSSSLLFIKR